MSLRSSWPPYFLHGFPLTRGVANRLSLRDLTGTSEWGTKRVPYLRHLAHRLPLLGPQPAPPAGELLLYSLLLDIFRHILFLQTEERHPDLIERILSTHSLSLELPPAAPTLSVFQKSYVEGGALLNRSSTPWPADTKPGQHRLVAELILLWLAQENRGIDHFRPLCDDQELASSAPFVALMEILDRGFAAGPTVAPLTLTTLELLRQPLKASPSSLKGQLEYVKRHWQQLVPLELLAELEQALAIVAEEEQLRFGGGGPPSILSFGNPGDDHYPEFEAFSRDADWMANVVMMAKMTYVWLYQLSQSYGRSITRLDQIPDEELDTLARWGFTSLWLIGVWERSPASRTIKQMTGNPEALSSAYSLFDYVIAADLGGNEALQQLKERAARRGIRLASDMVPNHTGIDSRWMREHPEWFLQLDQPPYPAYAYTGADLSSTPAMTVQIEDGYWSRRDAAVVFRHQDNSSGRVRYIYHGNDGTSTPWNDTAQLNYLLPEVREAVIQIIIQVARQFPVIRFDAAMTLAKRHFQRLWFPLPGHGGGVPSRAEHSLSRQRFDELFPQEFWRQVVDRLAVEAPDTLLLAEAFWLMEGYFVRTLGMHRVYNSAFMNMLKMEENAKYRQTLKNVLEFDPRVLQRFVNFMNNPDEKSAVEQFGREGKYLGACVMLVTLPGLPMLGHGQIEGFREKYGMEYGRPYWDEEVDRHLLALHEERIFPLMRRRWLFSGADQFVLYDFYSDWGVDEHVYAYSNRNGEASALIVYHNRFADTKGWIRTSTSMLRRSATGEKELVQVTLGEALGFNDNERAFYAFRDYATGLEYLRAGGELCDKGLYLELAGYHYHAFLDFRLLWDDDRHAWGTLCKRMEGQGVGSVDEEYRQVRFHGVIALLRRFLEESELATEREELTLSSGEAFIADHASTFFTLLAQELGDGASGAMGLSEAQALAASLHTISTLVSRVKDFKTSRDELLSPLLATGEMPTATPLLLLLVLLQGGDLVLQRGFHSEMSASWLDNLGLNRPVAEFIDRHRLLVAEWLQLDSEGGRQLIHLLTKHRELLLASSFDTAFKGLLQGEQSRRFLLVNSFEGVEWFNRERFTTLLQWLAISTLLSRCAAGADRPELAREVVRLATERRKLTSMAEESGYRLDTLISCMGNKEEKAPQPAPQGSGKAKTSSSKKAAPGGIRGSKRRQ